jgi:uncharacterized DUF497 family protein
MANLYIQALILYHLYTLKGEPIVQLQLLINHFKAADIEEVKKDLDLLIQKRYVDSTEKRSINMGEREPSTTGIEAFGHRKEKNRIIV